MTSKSDISKLKIVDQMGFGRLLINAGVKNQMEVLLKHVTILMSKIDGTNSFIKKFKI